MLCMLCMWEGYQKRHLATRPGKHALVICDQLAVSASQCLGDSASSVCRTIPMVFSGSELLPALLTLDRRDLQVQAQR